MPTPAYKRCNVCGESKPLDDFYRHKGKRDGRDSTCKACAIKRATAWNRSNPQRRAAIVKASRKRNPETDAARENAGAPEA